MKKTVFAAAFALLDLSGLWAAPVSWETTGGWTDQAFTTNDEMSAKGIYWKNDVAISGSMAIRVTYTGVSLLATPTGGNGWYCLVTMTGNGVNHSVAYSNMQHNATLGEGWYIDADTDIVPNPQPSFADVVGEGGTLTATFVYDDDAHTLAFYINDYCLGTTENLDLDGKTFAVTAGSASGGGSGIFSNIAELPDAPTLATAGIAFVPEPTALALLALGVAGMALRRRAA